MKTKIEEILSFDSLDIGYVSGRHKKLLLPPLKASAKKGEMIALIGRNGIGKSTLLRTLSGLQPVLGGKIYYDGRNKKEYSRMELARRVGYISTEIVNVSNMSVYDLVSLGRFPYTNWIGNIDSENHQIVMEAIQSTGMYDLRGRFVSELSDGERQRAMIARILAQDTGIMIMDEPTAFLDIGSKYEILHLMHELSRKRGKTIIFSTHDLHLALSQSDKIWLILDNSMKEGAPEDLLIEGAFDHLFDSSPVQFNAENGTYNFRSEERGSIYIDGEGSLKHWTEMAIKRAGYSVSPVKSDIYIKTPSLTNKKWQISSGSTTLESNTIYELVNSLYSELNQPI